MSKAVVSTSNADLFALFTMIPNAGDLPPYSQQARVLQSIFAHLIEVEGLTPTQAKATMIAKLQLCDDSINNRLVILDLIPEVQQAIDSGRISWTVACQGRSAAFFVWPQGEAKCVIRPEAQRHVLCGLLKLFKATVRGAPGRELALKLRQQAIKRWPSKI
jgi:hypothetical protein